MADNSNRQMTCLRLGVRGVDWIDQVALDETGRAPSRRKVTRSDVIRASLVVAKAHEKELLGVLRQR
jgi:hypothetical protein